MLILPRKPSFKERLGESLGEGLGAGFSKAADFAMQMAMESAKNKQRQQLLNQIQQKPSQGLPFQEEAIEETPLDQFAELMQEDPYQMAKEYAAIGEPELARIATAEAKGKERRTETEKKLAFDETKKYRETLSDQARSSEELAPVLKQMEHLIERGKLSNPVVAKLADKFGLVGLLNPDSQQFQALSIGFLKDAKSVFGARITNFDLQTYIDKIPRLAQTDAGKKVLIDNFKTLGKATKIRNRIKNEIIKKNRGIPPFDLEERVYQKAAPELDKLAESFNHTFREKIRSKSGKILMRSPSGQLGEVSEKDLDTAFEKGYILE